MPVLKMEINVIKRTTPIILFLMICVVGCQQQYNTYDEFNFKEVILCEGLDKNNYPIALSSPITPRETLGLCFDLETDQEFTFTTDWFGPINSRGTVVTIANSGWHSTSISNNGNEFPPGQYRVEVVVGRAKKAIKEFEIVESP